MAFLQSPPPARLVGAAGGADDALLLQCFPFGAADADCCSPAREGDPCVVSQQCRGASACRDGRCAGDDRCDSVCLLGGRRDHDCCMQETPAGCRSDADCLGRRACDARTGQCAGDSGCRRRADATETRAPRVVYDADCLCLQPGDLCYMERGVPCASSCRLWQDDGDRGLLHCSRA
jgi:hypothetical protein